MDEGEREKQKDKKTLKDSGWKGEKKKLQGVMISCIWKFSSKNKVSKTTSREIFPPVHVLLIHSNVMWKDLKVLEENLQC